MATCLDLCQAALRKIGALESGETATADEAADAIRVMTRMFGEWELSGIRFGPLVDRTLTTTTTIPLPASHLGVIENSLALRLAGEYGRPPDPALAALAEEGKRVLQTAYAYVPIARCDLAIVIGSRWRPPSTTDLVGGNF